MKLEILIVVISAIGVLTGMYRAYRNGRKMSKNDPVQLRKGDRIVYCRDMIDQIDAIVKYQIKGQVTIITEDDRELKVDRNKCHLKHES